MCFKALLIVSVFLLAAPVNSDAPVPVKDDSGVSPAIVIGFVGGFVRHDDPSKVKSNWPRVSARNLRPRQLSKHSRITMGIKPTGKFSPCWT